jgi:hypothetical protein
VYSEGEALIDPDTGISLGSTEEMVGAIEIAEVKEKFSIAYPVSGGGFKRGDSVRK